MWTDAATGPRARVTPAIDGYELLGELGRGAMSVVYRATRGGQSFAIKLMAGQADAAEARVLFRREAAAIARLDHPGLVRVVDLGEVAGRPYLVMELAEGESLDRRVTREPLSDDQVVALGAHLARALAEVHRYGLVHRDVKPANIIVDELGRSARLIDFGLVSGQADPDTIVGTLHYAAPEQLGVINRPVGPPADLYSLGATLWECLVGTPPMATYAYEELLHALATEPTPDLRDVRPGTGPALAAIIAKLLARDPDDRYQSATGLAADLDDLARLDAALRSGRRATLGTRDAAVSIGEVELVGRDRELDAVERVFARARSGKPSIATVEGEGGSGKTRLARELVKRARDRGALVLAGKCQELESTPFGPLREAADRYVARVMRFDDAEREAAMADLRRAAGEWAPLVRRLSGGLARILGETGEMRPLEPDAEQQRYYGALASFFCSLGTRERPLLLLVDDVQWLDEGSLRVLERVHDAEVDGAAVMVLATSRDGAAYQVALDRFVSRMGSGLQERLALSPLSEEATRDLITATLGGRPLDEASTQRLITLTQGNPFAIGQYLRTLLDQGVLRPTEGAWLADPAAFDAVQLPRDVIALVISRLYALGEEAGRVAGVAAALGGQFRLDVLAQSGAVGSSVSRAVEELSAAGLIEHGEGETYAFVHDRVREAALERLSPEELKDIHQAAAEALDRGDDLSAGDLYALARHYAAGHAERNPGRVVEVSLQAGLKALEDHANEEAFQLLDRALTLCPAVNGPPMRLLEGLGRACAMTGRLDRAFGHLEDALRLAKSREDRFRVQHLLTLTYASQGRNDEALEALYQAFEIMGRPFPRWRFTQILSLLGFWMLALVLRWTGIGRGKAKGEARERRRVLSQLHYSGSMIALFQGDPILMVQFVVRDFYNVHFLGSTPETAVASAVYGAVLGMFKLRGVMQRYTRFGVELAEQLGDRAALAVARAYQACGAKWSGDLVHGNELMVAALPELDRQVPGSWYTAMMICEHAYSQLHAGNSATTISHIRAHREPLARTNNLMFRWNTLSVEYAAKMVTGDIAGASKLWSQLEPEYEPLSQTIYVRLARAIADLEVLVDQDETGPDVDAAILAFNDLVSEDYYSNAARMLVGYARLAQLEKAPRERRRAARRAVLKAARSLSLRALVPVFKCHPHIWRAAVARLDGRYEKARKHLRKADRLAAACQSKRGAFHAAVERARLARAIGDSATTYLANAALDIATSEGWRRKGRRVRSEFSLESARAETNVALTRVQSTTPRSVEQSQRYAKALLQVSLASASTLDVETLARNALHEVAQVLGAERALFFTLDPETGALDRMASSGAGSERVSQTVVRRVAETGRPLVLTGTDDGEMLNTQSIMSQGLRSIIAAPLLFQDRLLGVVYLDSRVAKGMFTEDDVSLLLGVSNHIAIAIETARAAQLEAERSAYARDLELVGAVQNLIMPKASKLEAPGLRGVGHFRPATQCGGDWWWYEHLPDGSTLFLLGDVNGHGAAAAMVTSAVAGAFMTLRDRLPEMSPPAVLDELGRCVRGFGDYHMTMALVRVDPARRELGLWNAASPGFFLASGGRCRAVMAPGHVLGDAEPAEYGATLVDFDPGDRVLLCTDGLLELRTAEGRVVGPRGVAQLFGRLSSAPIDDVAARIADEVAQHVQGNTQADDITFVVFESVDPASADG